MLVNADVKGLEVVVAADRYDDKVLKQELVDGVDIHEVNRDKFKLGSGKDGRRVAKFFKFRMIYGGGAWSYAHDPNFTHVSTSIKFWERVIDQYYEKYQGIAKGHARDLQQVRETRELAIPSGRTFQFEPEIKRGELTWPQTKIKNYPIQGFGSDLVLLARVEAYKLFKASGMEGFFIQTIHDSLVYDVPDKNVAATAKILSESIAKVPELCYTNWNYKFSLPLTSEIQVGMNKKEMSDYKIN